MSFTQEQAAAFLRVPMRTYQNWEGGGPHAFPEWLRQQLRRPKGKRAGADASAQLSFGEAE